MVPLCFEKSLWMIIAMLSVMKAKGAFVCLNPMSRLESMIQNVKAQVLLASPLHAGSFEGIVKKVLTLSSTLVTSLPDNSDVAFIEPHPRNLAYVVFTSGSTGNPKGIMVEHASICTSLQSHGDAMRIDSESRVLQFADYTFAVSIGDIFTTLLRGGCVCVPSEYDRMSSLGRFIKEMNVSHACVTPTVANLLRPEDVSNLKFLTLGGEAATHENVGVWAEKVPLANIYGPAECSVWCVHNDGLRQDTNPGRIGRAINKTCWTGSQIQ